MKSKWGFKMAKIFISHSSNDKPFIRKLKGDLEELGHEIWMDESEIKIGRSIPSKIQDGISNADYLILVLTPSSMSSKWVDKEWKAAHSLEIEEDRTIILPIYLEKCNIPLLLKDRLYSDFRESYSIGLVKLINSIDNPDIIQNEDMMGELAQEQKQSGKLVELLTEIQDKSLPLAPTLVKVLSFAKKYHYNELAEFCEKELSGWVDNQEEPKFRIVERFWSIAPLNKEYVNSLGDVSTLFLTLEKNSMVQKDYVPIRNPISILEQCNSQKQKEGYFEWIEEFVPDEGDGYKIYCYTKADTVKGVIEGIRAELTSRLLKL